MPQRTKFSFLSGLPKLDDRQACYLVDRNLLQYLNIEGSCLLLTVDATEEQKDLSQIAKLLEDLPKVDRFIVIGGGITCDN